MKFKIAHKGLVLIAVPLAIELMILGGLARLLSESEHATAKESRAREIMFQTSELRRLVEETLFTAGGFNAMRLPDSFRRYVENKKDVRQAEASIRTRINSDREKLLFDNLAQDIDKSFQLMDSSMEFFKTASEDTGEHRFRELEREMRVIKESLRDKSALLTQEAALAKQNSELMNGVSRQNLKGLLGLALGLNVFAAIALTVYFGRGITGRLKTLTTNSVRLASGQELLAPISGNDELFDLDKAFRWMAKELAESARKERAMIENAVEVICSIAKDGQFLKVNPASLTVWGYPADDLTGQRYISIVRESDRDKTTEAVSAAIEKQLPLSFECGIKKKDGTFAEVKWSGGWSSQEQSLFCVLHDITEMKRIEKMKQDFVAMISHDLRTPLTSVQIFLEMISEGFFENDHAKQRDKAKRSETDVARLIELINNLLDVEKLEAGNMEILPSDTLTSMISERSINSVQALAEKKKIKIVDESQKIDLYADEDMLVQVIVNFLSNAIKFSPEGSTIRVAAFSKDRQVEFQVIDEGRGIGPDHIHKVFDRFSQVEADDQRKKGGSGLGLAVCKSIVEAHKGEIGVLSEEGKGSTFWFRVPEES